MKKREFITIKGTVQGVGFRPFLHRLSKEYQLSGTVRNTGEGVELEWEGDRELLDAALAVLAGKESLPPMAVITDLVRREIPVTEKDGFVILPSRIGGEDTLIPPDIAPCEACLREMRDPKDRRYRYPFLNCTNCGPRFTIVKGVPYDRARTSMSPFAMCERCEEEYKDLEDRRYHAQPTCCPECGPTLFYADEEGCTVETGDGCIQKAIRLLEEGKILAVKGLGGYHLACRIEKDEFAQRLRERKNRRYKPLAVMCRNRTAADKLGVIHQKEGEWLESPARPIVLVKKRIQGSYPVLSKTDRLGLMLPYTPLHELLFDGASYDALVMTSANRSEVPVEIRDQESIEALKGIADGFLFHNRPIEARCDDSLIQITEGSVCFFRRSRGYVPKPIVLHRNVQGILALGAEEKASFAYGKGSNAFYSQHIGDLKNMETFAHYEEQIRRFSALFGVRPQRLVCDLHPDFLSTRYAKDLAQEEEISLLQVQHHHAHMASVMAEHGLEGDCIGVIWDGTGLGRDGTIWGSEFFAGSYEKVSRKGALRGLALPGGDAAVTEISRIGLSLLQDAQADPRSTEEEKQLLKKSMEAVIPEEGRRRIFLQMLERRLNCPISSGMGRLFDGVYAILTGEGISHYEGERAVQLEDLATRAQEESGTYALPIQKRQDGLLEGDVRPMIRALAADRSRGIQTEILARRFHNTLIRWGLAMCDIIRKDTGLNRVVLGGGVFFNQILSAGIRKGLEEMGFEVFLSEQVSPSDEGIALGQLAIASAVQTEK